MFGLGMGEIMLILVVALLALGPDKLPKAVGQISNAIRGFRKQTKELQSTLEEDTKFGDAVREIKSAMYDDPTRPPPKPRARPPTPTAPTAPTATAPTATAPTATAPTATAPTATARPSSPVERPKAPADARPDPRTHKASAAPAAAAPARHKASAAPAPRAASPPPIPVTAPDTVAKDDAVATDSESSSAEADESAHG